MTRFVLASSNLAAPVIRPTPVIQSVTTQKRAQFQSHPWHLVDQSPWPLLTSFALFSLALGAAAYFHGFAGGGHVALLGLISVTAAMVLWLRDVAAEGTLGGYHTIPVQKGLILGFVLFVVSEAFAFLSAFWAFLHSALAPAVEIGSAWPPAGIETLDFTEIPLLNTVLLLSSGATITYAHHALLRGARGHAIAGLALTVTLAVIFTAFQAYEYIEAPFTISDSVYGSAFFCCTGLHGFHVIIGTIFLAVSLYRLLNYSITAEHHIGLESASVYWHFVDVVWLFLFLLIYIWGS
jgi:cytochrome c oxidase subunit 3